MIKKKTELSEEINSFLQLLARVQAQAEESYLTEMEMERLQQDLLHQLELEDTSYHNRAHIASQLKQCRTKRRIAKDFLAASEPLVNYLKTDKGKMAVSQIREVMGQTRRAEKAAKNRGYVPRVMSQQEYYKYRKQANDMQHIHDYNYT